MSAQPPMPPVLAGNVTARGIARAIALCTAYDSDHHIPLFQGVAAGRIGMTGLWNRLSRPNIHGLRKTHRPALILVGDDDGATTGPLGWAATGQLASWARCALVHATGGDRRSYGMAISMAEDSGRALLIETASNAAEGWLSVLRAADVPTVLLLPTGDGVHPVEPEQGQAA